MIHLIDFIDIVLVEAIIDEREWLMCIMTSEHIKPCQLIRFFCKCISHSTVPVLLSDKVDDRLHDIKFTIEI